MIMAVSSQTAFHCPPDSLEIPCMINCEPWLDIWRSEGGLTSLQTSSKSRWSST